MKIKYVGPKTLISTQGISFDKRKIDKFIYIETVLELIEAMDYDYVEERPHIYTTESRELVGEDILKRVKVYCPDITSVIVQAERDADAYVEADLDRTRNTTLLNAEDLRTLINNQMIMRDYTIQRYINKYIYYHVIKECIKRLRHKKIKYISATAHKTYFHVFNTIKKGLNQQKNAVDSELTFYVQNRELFIKLQVLSS